MGGHQVVTLVTTRCEKYSSSLMLAALPSSLRAPSPRTALGGLRVTSNSIDASARAIETEQDCAERSP